MTNKRAVLPLDAGEIRKALGDPDTAGLVLFTIALHEFGPAVTGDDDEGIEALDPAEMWAGLHSTYGTWVTEEGENKLNAILTGLQDGGFWYDIDVFMAVTTALFDGDLGDLINAGFEDLSATEIMWAILEMRLVLDGQDAPRFSSEIRRYINEALLVEQDDHHENSLELERGYLQMLDQLKALGVPNAAIRLWDAEYADVLDSLEDAHV